MNPITALPVERDAYGCWTHPAYDEFCGEREHIPNAEFQAWLKEYGLEWDYELRDDSIIDFETDCDGADFSKWQPAPPAGEGWFIGSIHDTEDGPVCIWFLTVPSLNITGGLHQILMSLTAERGIEVFDPVMGRPGTKYYVWGEAQSDDQFSVISWCVDLSVPVVPQTSKD